VGSGDVFFCHSGDTVAFRLARTFVVLTVFTGLASQADSQSIDKSSRVVEPRLTRAINDRELVRLKGNVHRLAKTPFDQGIAPPSLVMDRLQLVLSRGPEQQTELKSLLEAQQDRTSPQFHQWLTPEQFGNRFGPADSDIQIAIGWLQSQGFQVNGIAKGKTVIEFSGTAGQIANAFHTEIHKYVMNGEEHWANASDPQIPAALAPVVAGTATLHNFRAKSMARISDTWPIVQTSHGTRPEFNLSAGTHGLGPADYAAIYNINPLYQAGINGTGVTIGVIGVDMIAVQDIEDFRNAFALPENPPQIITNGTIPDLFANDEDMEGTLDVSWSGAVAPNASIKFIVSISTDAADGLSLSEQYAVDNNVADILTESFGICESNMTAAQAQQSNALREQAAAQGITWVVASGDFGPYCDDGWYNTTDPGPLSVSGTAASPYVIAVGGTEFGSATNSPVFWAPNTTPLTLKSALSYIPETVWNDSCDVSQCGGFNAGPESSGGGASTFYAKPAWQSGVAGIPQDGFRDVPDLSLSASPRTDPYLVCYQGGCYPPVSVTSFTPIGGTSASAPSFAGIMALVVQKTGSRQGQANYVLYPLAASQQYSHCVALDAAKITQLPASACIFNDITTSNSAVPGEPGYTPSGTTGTSSTTALFQAGPGYDLATGLGSVNVTNLVNSWGTVAFHPTNTNLTLSPTTLVHGSAATVAVTVTPQSGTGVPTGEIGVVTTGWANSDLLTLFAGSASTSLWTLPGGTYNVTAHYGGDVTYGASNSAPVAVTVTPEPSSTRAGGLTVNTLGLYPSVPNAFFPGGFYGTDYLVLSARVAGTSGHGVPTGTISFTDNGEPVGQNGTLNSQGQALNGYTSLLLQPGRHFIAARYSGDASFLPSLSPPSIVNITPAPTVTSVESSITTAMSSFVSLTALVDTRAAPFGDQPAGTVTFSSNGQVLREPIAVYPEFDNNSFTTVYRAHLQLDLPTFGNNSIVAVYSGDANYAPSTSSPVLVTVGPLNRACGVGTFTADPNPISIYDLPGYSTITVQTDCEFDIRVNGPSGPLLGTATNAYSASVGPWITDGMVFYLQLHGNTTAQGTLGTLAMLAQTGTEPCVVHAFAATPNPIIAPNGLGITTIAGVSSCDFEVRVDSPAGPVFTSSVLSQQTGQYNVTAPTGIWVHDGMRFFMQPRGKVTSQATLATVTVPVLAAQPVCEVAEFSANPSLIITPTGYGETIITAGAGCAFDVRLGAPNGPLLNSSTTGYSSKDTGPGVTNGTTYYLQLLDDATPKGTLRTVRVSVLPYAPLCDATQFTANPNPITTTGGLGQTTITVVAACSFDVRIGSPNGPLWASSAGSFSAQTGDWVTDGMTFFLQFGGNTTDQGTLGTVRISSAQTSPFACTVTQFSASPNPIITAANLGVATITTNAQCPYDVRVGAPDGPLFASGAGLTSAQTGLWVTNGLTFYLQSLGNTQSQGTLAKLTVALQP
jgi:hypothetical protein